MSQKTTEKKIAYDKMIRQKDTTILIIQEALNEISKEEFHVTLLEQSAPLDRISHAIKTLYQIGYASSLIIVEETE